MQQRRRRDRACGQLRAQRVLPFARERRLVAHLRGFRALRKIGAGSRAFVVDDQRSRLVQHAQAGAAHREGEVGVLVIGRGVANIEAVKPFEQRARDRDRRAAAVIGIAHVGEPAVVGRFAATVVPAGAVGEYHAAGFLQAAVGIHELGADQAGVRMSLEGLQHRIQPARLRHGVVVEEDQELAARQRRAVVAGGDEAAIGFAGVHAQAIDPGELRQRVVRRSVVDHDQLERGPRRMRGQRAQAGEGVRERAMDRDHDAGARRRGGGDREPGERRGLRRIQGLGRDRAAPEVQLEPLPARRQPAVAQAGPAASPQAQPARDPEARFGGDGHAAELRLINSD